jgi:lysophospholipase L1-like esterase
VGVMTTTYAKKKILKNLLLFGFALLLSCILAELVVYVFYKDRIVFFPRYVTNVDYGIYKIRRNIPYAHYYHKSIDGRWEFRINSKGFRSDKDHSYSKPDGLIRILTIGDSFTLGYEVNQNETYSVIVEKYLKQQGINVEVINAGVSGFSTAEELVFFKEEGIKYNPDILILGFYENDLDDNLRADLYRVVNNKLVLNKTEYLPAIKARNFLNSFFIYRWLSEHSYLHNYLNSSATAFIKNRIQRKNENNLVKLSNNLSNHKELLAVKLVKEIGSIAKLNNIYFVLLDIPGKELKSSVPDLKRYGSAVSCDFYFDAASILKKYEGSVDLYMPNGHRHWTAFTHSVIGKNIGKKLLEHLDKTVK